MKKTFCLVCFILGVFLLSVGFGLMFGESDAASKFIARAPVFAAPVSNAPLSPQKIIDLVNLARSDLGLKPLERDPALDFIAYIRTENIMANGDFSHEANKSGNLTYNKIADRLLMQYKEIGENLALGDFDGEEKTLVNAWLNSRGHREVLLGNYGLVGVFTLSGDFNGAPSIVTVWVSALERVAN
jgi:uncharacterized protein YkwD